MVVVNMQPALTLKLKADCASAFLFDQHLIQFFKSDRIPLFVIDRRVHS